MSDINKELVNIIADTFEDFGYVDLFFTLWLGVFGLPIPNEAIIMSIGFAASQKLFPITIIFVITYCGLLAAVTTIYSLGFVIGGPIIKWFEKNHRRKKHIHKALALIEKYHSFSLCISYFIPGLRNFVPFCYGLSRLPYQKFALFSYSTIFIWLIIFFTLGYKFGNNIETIMKYDEEILIILGCFVGVISIIRIIFLKKANRFHANNKLGE